MKNNANQHRFGGVWTEIKLDILQRYLCFYTTALKNKNFELLYIDAFAGSGDRVEVIPGAPLLGEHEKNVIYDGSAKIALEISPSFDRYLFIENNPSRYIALEELVNNYPDKYIRISNEDANKVIQEKCNNASWSTNKYRGVIFLDPYGNVVEWETLEAIASTRSLDVWFLFPISGVYRQASHDFNSIEEYKKANLNKIFGTDEWERAFYKKEKMPDLFGETEATERIGVKNIEDWVKNRLEDCFYSVLDPLPLPRTGAQLFSLFFCVSNTSDKALGLAIKAANYILKQQQ